MASGATSRYLGGAVGGGAPRGNPVRLPCWPAGNTRAQRTQMVARLFSPPFSLSGVDRPCANRAPGASTYIRQLHDGLPQSCMHSADDRGDGVTLFAGARDANRILEQPVAPLPAGPEALKSRR